MSLEELLPSSDIILGIIDLVMGVIILIALQSDSLWSRVFTYIIAVYLITVGLVAIILSALIL